MPVNKRIVLTVRIIVMAFFLIAGITNLHAGAMGSQATFLGFVSTLIALLSWLVYGFWTGVTAQPQERLWFFPLLFWSGVVIFSCGGWLLLMAIEGTAAGRVMAILPLVAGTAVFLGAFPFAGLTFISGVSATIPLVACASVILFAMTMLAAWLGRRLRRARSHA